ncbi:SMI1/KNR4 family protein [Streptomyces sp. NPDC007206]|uniref:SMI1/KNR4 family protein n=1 Tax=Streptomyces sp. NPDC007206 TaxID=3154317 RepID=UPI0033E1CEB7
MHEAELRVGEVHGGVLQPGSSGVRERVIAVEEAERRARGRGPSRYPTFEPVLTPAEIAEVEAQFGVALPDEYRTFLAEVGAGGPGAGIRAHVVAPNRREVGIGLGKRRGPSLAAGHQWAVR